jgi:hypothetical protein
VKNILLAACLTTGACIAAGAQTVTLNVNGNGTATFVSGLTFNVALMGTATFSNLGSSTFSIHTNLDLSAAPSTVVSAPVTFTFPSGATLTGTVSGRQDAFILINSNNFSGTVTLTITSGTGQLSGATGSFASLATSGTSTCAQAAAAKPSSRSPRGIATQPCSEAFFTESFNATGSGTLALPTAPSQVPIPNALWLTATALLALPLLRARRWFARG